LLDTSPILHDLAARIREEHDAAEAAKGAAVVVARKGIEHALTAGELLLEAKAQVPHGQWLPWLAENCPAVSPRMAQYYMGLARKRPELESKYETVSHLTLREAVQLLEEDEGEDESEDDDRAYDEWYTPPNILDAVRDVLGTIDLDPASCDQAQPTVQAIRYYTKDDDGLKQEWRGRVWLNPPFSNPLNVHFVNKLLAEVASGRVTEAILLVNILPSAWLQDAIKACSAVCFSRDRLRFTHQTGKVQTNKHNLAIMYFGPDVEKFARRFAEFGCVKSNLRPDSVPSEDKAEPSGHGDEWYTPSEYVEVVRDVFGGVIDLDPASCDEAQQIVQAKRYYTNDDDGLKQPWSGRVFLNPPYSNPTPFVDRLIEHYERGDVPEAILLENTDSSARWFHKALKACSALCFPSSRIKFRHGREGCSPRYSSVFFYFGEEVERFRRRFASVGSVVIVKAPDNSSHRQMTVIVELVPRQQSGERRAT
jgi:phage N-6-adenine-methyltransferase